MLQAPVPTPVPDAGSPAISAAWVSARSIVPAAGIARAPDGSLVTAEPVGKHGGHENLVRLTAGSAPTDLEVRSIGTDDARDPLLIEGTGEAVYALTTGIGFREYSRLLRTRGRDEVPGPTALDDDTVDLATMVRLDHRHLGTATQREGKRGPVIQAATISPRGFHWIGPKNTKLLSSLFLFNPVSDETGTLVDASDALEWRYPSAPARFDVPNRAPGQPEVSVDTSIGSSATGLGRTVLRSAKGSGTLKVQTYAKDGTPNTEGPGDGFLIASTRGQQDAIIPVPIPTELDASCLAGSLTDKHGARITSLWNGPDGDVWSVAGCAGQGSVEGKVTQRWLVHWDRATYASGIVRLPPDRSQAAATGGRGFTGPGGVMYVAGLGGTLAVTGLQSPAVPKARLQRIRAVARNRVQAEVRCTGTVGAACFGRVRFSDAGGTLGTVTYGVDAGTAAMDPVAVRELRVARVLRGPIRAKLLTDRP